MVVDRFLIERTMDVVIESLNKLHSTDFSSEKMDLYHEASSSKLVECRICHDEDQDSSMETPCTCRGTLKVRLFLILFQDFGI